MITHERGLGRRPIGNNRAEEVKPPSLANRPGFFDKGMDSSITGFFLLVSMIGNEAVAWHCPKGNTALIERIKVNAWLLSGPAHPEMTGNICAAGNLNAGFGYLKVNPF
jgi:hypothetical protein